MDYVGAFCEIGQFQGFKTSRGECKEKYFFKKYCLPNKKVEKIIMKFSSCTYACELNHNYKLFLKKTYRDIC